MSKNIIICADGTSNSFKTRTSNVAQLVRLLDYRNHRNQVVVYDQGIGTETRRAKQINEFRKSLDDRSALHVCRSPFKSNFSPREFASTMLGLAFGYGLKENVGQMYSELASLYESGDRVFLFGFSRGAFTVRALAGLLYRCGLPSKGSDAKQEFKFAWEAYKPMRARDERNAALIAPRRECSIHFLGIWDTVKSYGGLKPVILPHLRHNPIVETVRHALSLDEERAGFEVTTWGRLDLDMKPCGAMSRLNKSEHARMLMQDIEEVWFRGCHSDIGGGDIDTGTSHIALRWMLGEAYAAGLDLNADGAALLQPTDERESPKIHPVTGIKWWVMARIPRLMIDNEGTWPRRSWVRRSDGRRYPCHVMRAHHITVHESVDTFADGKGVRIARTKTLSGDEIDAMGRRCDRRQ